MKKLLLSLALIAISCQGPVGPQGTPGIDGTNGTDGIDATQQQPIVLTGTLWDDTEIWDITLPDTPFTAIDVRTRDGDNFLWRSPEWLYNDSLVRIIIGHGTTSGDEYKITLWL